MEQHLVGVNSFRLIAPLPMNLFNKLLRNKSHQLLFNGVMRQTMRRALMRNPPRRSTTTNLRQCSRCPPPPPPLSTTTTRMYPAECTHRRQVATHPAPQPRPDGKTPQPFGITETRRRPMRSCNITSTPSRWARRGSREGTRISMIGS